ncbi:MAG: glycosyltransferase family 4 protein [bacterium]
MRVLIIEFRDITHPEAGGAEVVLLEVFKRIVAAGHQVDYLCNGHRGAKREEVMEGLRVIRRGRQPFFNLLVPYVYRRELRRNGYDLIIEGIDKLPFFMPLFERKVPVLGVVPHLFGSTVFQEASWPVGAYVYAHERLIPYVYRNCLFSVLCQGTRDDLIRRGLPAGHIQVIHSGLSQERYSAPDEKPFADHPVLVYVGRVKKYKGIEIGIRALKLLRDKYPTLECLVVGKGDYLEPLRRMTGQLGLAGHVTFRGYVSESEKILILQKSRLLLQTSPKEGWGLSVVEANACGTPVVASDSPGLRESVVDGRTGFLVPHGDVPALAQRIDQLLSDEALYARMRAAAVEWGQGFTWERGAKETLALMERACAGFKR